MKRKKLGELTTLISRGISPKYVDSSENIVLNQKCIRNNRVDFRLARKFSPNQKVKKGCLIQDGDVLINSTGTGTLGRTAIFRGNERNITVDSHITIVRPNTELIDQYFLGYLLELIEPTIENLGGGSTGQTELSRRDIANLELLIPELSIQRVVSSTIQEFDNLLDVNNQLISKLESIAKDIYKEWFIRMRFPNFHLMSSNKGIPANWNVVAIGNVIDYHIGGGWGNDSVDKEFSISGFVIRGTDIPKIRSGQINPEVLRYHKVSNMKSRELIEGDIVFETAGGSEGQPLGRTCFITKEILEAYGDKVMAASFCKQIRTTSIPSMYLYYFLNYLWDTGMIETYQVQSTGISNFQFEPFLKFQQIILPDKDLMQKFHDIVLPMHKQIAILGTQNSKLSEIRDRLLPRLISGKLEVKSGEIGSTKPSSTKEVNLA